MSCQLVVDGLEQLREKLARRLEREALRAIAARGRFSVALAAAGVDWSRTDFFWGDERAVSPDHPESNFGVARQLWLEPARVPVAIGAALTTELFGFSSGLYAYAKRRLIDYRLGGALLMFSVPAAIAGSLGAELFPAIVLKSIFAVGIILIGMQLYLSYRQEQREKLDQEIGDQARMDFESELTAADGTTYRYTICAKNQGRFFAAIGGAFLRMISVGLAELQEYHLVARCRVPSAVAVSTSIFVVVIPVLVASVGHLYNLTTSADPDLLNQVVGVVVFTAPGVVVGGQLGPMLQARVNPDIMKVAISSLFVAVGLFMLVTLGA